MTDHEENQPDESAPKFRRQVPEDSIGDRIREAREGRGWTQKVLSTQTRLMDPNAEGISRTVLVGYEAGKTKPGAREIRILADTLNVTPNWLLLGNVTPTTAVLPSMAFLTRGNELQKALRVGFAMQLLKQHEREMLGMLLFSLGGRELGDARLSGLMHMSDLVASEVLESLQTEFPELLTAGPSPEVLSALIRQLGDGQESNVGTKLRGTEDGTWEGEWLYKPPPEDMP